MLKSSIRINSFKHLDILKLIHTRYSSSNIPSHARVVICGSGAVANVAAYTLTKNGWNDVLVLEQNTINSGTSNYSVGLIGLFKPIAMRNIIMESLKLYRQLEDMGYNIGLQQCGTICLAQKQDRMIALQRRMSYNLPTGLNCELLTKNEILDKHPYLNVSDLEGGVWIPEDSVADAAAICTALIDLAKKNGVVYRENCEVQYVLTEKNRVVGVETNAGKITCDYFLNTAGMWCRELGLKSSPPVRIPAYPAEHFYAVSTNMNLDTDNILPSIRDYDSFSYSRQINDEFLVGWFEKTTNPAYDDCIVPKDWNSKLKNEFPHFKALWEKAIHRMPELANSGDPIITNTPDNFTPDGRWCLGETAEIKNYFVAVGMNGNAVQGAGGVGKAVAEWMIAGKATQELFPFSVQRFLDLHNNRQYLQERVKEVVGRHYAILYPNQSEYKYARKLRCSPLYSVLESRGAVFGTKMAYERALYFDTSYKRGQSLPKMPQGSFFKPKFFNFMNDEYQACKKTVGLLDLSSFSKIEIKSPNAFDVVNYLQYMCSNDIDIDVGGIVHTGMQNQMGGYENDCMVCRTEKNSFFVVSPSSQQTKVIGWMNANLPIDANGKSSIKVTDMTSMYTVINVVGPKATTLLSELSNSNLKLAPFKYMKCNIGFASDVVVMSFTHTGEKGYCLYIPTEYALHVYENLMTVGFDFGIMDVGTITQRYMRIEKFIPFWAEELTGFITPFEAGMDKYVNFDKPGDFIGKQALLKQKQNGIKKKLIMLVIEDMDVDKDVWAWGNEVIYRNSEYVGTVTSAGFAFSTNKIVCLGFISNPSKQPITEEFILDKTAKYQLDICGKLFTATPYLQQPSILNELESEIESKKSYKPTVLSVKQQFRN